MNKYSRDLKLTKLLIRGDEHAFNVFFDEYHPKLFRFIMSRVNQDYDLANDLAQDTLCKALDKISDYRGEAALFTWMCQISRSMIHAHFIKNNRRAKFVQPIADSDDMRHILENIAMSDQDEPEKITMNQQLKQIIEEVLDHLPENYGNILTCKYIEQLSVNEIAEKFSMTQIAVQSSLSRARKSFQQVISKMLDHDTLRDLLLEQKAHNHG
ncbi:sigma-70 family RNA polymerase sigma factor [Marinicella sp. S1101]|nr:sigma-70 family RNA polymerase sigma factor [Marinicella marina]MCX7554199.1 sigma-70 family RNA polymerase sigma factor [Marinicella marina]MDJ1141108.1 sigma-70 family RNA polymerase sigma factor [Marinicella marina]